MTTPWLTIIGINEDATLSPEAQAHLAQATLVLGGARHLALAAPHIRAETRPWPTPMADAIPPLLARRPAPTVVLASGDPLWFGVATLLLRHIPLAETRILPAPSIFALAAARLGWALQDVACLSCCGRPVEALARHLHPGARLLVLSADAATPAAIAGLLAANDQAASTLHVLEALGSPAERIRTNPGLHDLHPLNLVAIEVAGRPGPPLTTLEDTAYDHDGQITKSEIRAITLAALAPRPGQLLWDVGAGSGSIGIEWLRTHPACRAIAIERNPVRAARARRNAAAHAVPLEIIEAEAPAALAGLPRPDAVFLGAAAHRPGTIDAAWSALPQGGRLVANAIALATEAALAAAQARHGGTLRRIAIERLDQVGGMPAYRPAMTVTQWRATK